MALRSQRYAWLAIGACALATATLADDFSEPVSDEPQKVIVLLNGRVILGDVIERPGGYLVDNTIGQMVLPFTQVRLTAVDLPDAYRKLKATMTEPTASGHVSLGEWCYSNRLYNSAREQVKAALILEPERKDARTLLKNIERVAIGDAVMASIPAPPAKSRDGFETTEAQSLEGLSPSVTQDFVRRVQPLLMNKCGNARCHGVAGTSEFRLTPVRLGMSGFRSLTDQNLYAVLRKIDTQQPRTSPLLVVATGTHGGKGEIWTGPRADEQLAELRSWVTRVALEQGQKDLITGGAVVQASADVPEASVKRDPFLREILDEERPDKFDPKVFNKLMHGRP